MASFRIPYRVCAAASIAFAAFLSVEDVAAQIVPPNESLLRPMVYMQWPAAPTNAGIDNTAAARVAVGIFDTGDPLNTISPETLTLINPGLLPATPNPTPPAPPPPPPFPAPLGRVGGIPADRNQFAVTVDNTFSGSGVLGSIPFGPEVTLQAPRAGQPAHIFSAVDMLNRTEPITRGDYQNVVEYYNGRNSENHIGMPFVSQQPGGGTRLVAEVDPINARVMPDRVMAFPYDNPPSDRLGIGGVSLPLDQQTSSVSFFANNDVRLPTLPKNADPGHVFQIQITPGDFNNGNALGGSFDTVNTNTGFSDTTNGASIAPRPFLAGLTVTVGATRNTSDYLMDTGAPSTSMPAAVYNLLPNLGFGVARILPRLDLPLVGGGVLTLTNVPVACDAGRYLVGGNNNCAPDPARPTPTPVVGANIFNMFGQFWDFERQTLTLTGPIQPDILFSVDRATLGLSRTGVNQETRFGFSSNAPEQAGDVFRTNVTGSNALFINDTALSLVQGDHVDALSFGQDTIGIGSSLAFSVDRTSVGLGTSVTTQAALGQQASDIFVSNTGNNLRLVGQDSLLYNQELLGLGVGGNAVGRENMGPSWNAGGLQDNLGDFVLQRPRVIDPLADPIVSAGALQQEPFRTYFSLDQFSPSLGGGLKADDILLSRPGGLNKFADGVINMGLNAADDLDALALDDFQIRTGFLDQGNRTINNNIFSLLGVDFGLADLGLFSLAPWSPTLAAWGLSAADVFITDFDGTFHLFAAAESLGLNSFDNIDGLTTVPEPSTLALILIASLGLVFAHRVTPPRKTGPTPRARKLYFQTVYISGELTSAGDSNPVSAAKAQKHSSFQ